MKVSGRLGRSKSKFTAEEDKLLISLVKSGASWDWASIASQFENKTSRQCRERWQNYLDPLLSKKDWTKEEDDLLLMRYNKIGPHWNAIARTFTGRSGNTVRNRYMKLIRQSERKVLKEKCDIEIDLKPEKYDTFQRQIEAKATNIETANENKNNFPFVFDRYEPELLSDFTTNIDANKFDMFYSIFD